MQKGVFLSRTESLSSAFKRMNNDERNRVAQAHAFYEAQLSAARKSGHQPEGIAAGMHDTIDEAVTHTKAVAPRASEVSCRKGCSHCCHIDVCITIEEAKLLVYAADEAGVAIDAERLAAQAAPKRWADVPQEERACVFLGSDGACRVYEHRPTVCRKHHVVSPPDECDTFKNPGHKVLNFVSIEAEIFCSAAFAALPSGRMAQMLLKATQETTAEQT
jgi:Fe-S-cluster containining protein